MSQAEATCFIRQKTAYDLEAGLGGSEMCIRDGCWGRGAGDLVAINAGPNPRNNSVRPPIFTRADLTGFKVVGVPRVVIIKDGDVRWRRRIGPMSLDETYSRIPVSYTHLTLPTSDLV